MQSTNIPDGFSIPFANAAGGAFIRAIPLNPPGEDGAASLSEGFPPETFDPVATGGIPPFGQDFNGLFNQITAWNRWQKAGAPVAYDAAFQTAIGGYPKGAYVMSTVQLGLYWLSTVENNATNPDTGGAGWARYAAPNLYAVGGGSANALTATFTPALVAPLVGQTLYVKAAVTNTGASTFNPNGLGAQAIKMPNGAATPPSIIIAGAIIGLTWDGVNFQLGAGNTPANLFGSLVTNDTNMGAGAWYRVDATVASHNLVLPAAPSNGDIIRVTDIYGGFSLRPWTVQRNGQTIMGLAQDMICNVGGIDFLIQYNGTDWRLF